MRKPPLATSMALTGLMFMLTSMSCTTPAKTERKEMPAFNSIGISEEGPPQYTQLEGIPLYTRPVVIETDQQTDDFVAVSLPDPALDSLATQLVLSQAPMAASLLKQWSTAVRKGICIDLRTGTDGSAGDHREDFTLQIPEGPSLPVVFLWDGTSAQRAESFIELLRSTTTIDFQTADSGSTLFY